MPVTVDVDVSASEPVTTVAQLSRELGMHDGNVHRYIRRLKAIGHRAFLSEETGGGLSELRASVIKRYRYLSVVKRLRGESLIDAINLYPPPPNDIAARLKAEYERLGVPEALVSEVVQATIEVINA